VSRCLVVTTAAVAVGATPLTVTHIRHTAADIGPRIMLIGTAAIGIMGHGAPECMDTVALTLLTAVGLAADGREDVR
jgi:hypothetical protein